MTAANDSLTDAAGTAIVSISTVTPSVHIMVVFTGILSGKRKNDNLLLLRLFAEDKPTAVFEEVSLYGAVYHCTTVTTTTTTTTMQERRER